MTFGDFQLVKPCPIRLNGIPFRSQETTGLPLRCVWTSCLVWDEGLRTEVPALRFFVAPVEFVNIGGDSVGEVARGFVGRVVGDVVSGYSRPWSRDYAKGRVVTTLCYCSREMAIEYVL